MIKRIKKHFLIYLFAAGALFSLAATDNYFEISKNLEIFADIYKTLDLYYVDEINPNELIRTGIDAMLASLDPYTNFYSEAELENYRFQTTGKYGGIGAVIRQKGDYIAIIEPYENSPALKAGLQAGDLIIEINGQSTRHLKVEDASKLLKGNPGTTVDLLVRREGFLQDQLIRVEREEIKIENVPFYGMINDSVGYIKFTQFTRDAGKNVSKAFKALKAGHKLKGLVLDLRGNPGGLLNEAVNVCNIFIPKNKLVVSTKGKVSDWNRDFKTLNQPLDTEIPLTVLISSGSASASEIVSGTLQDYDRAVIVGQTSFGKGLVQNTHELSYKTILKLTTAKYYIPSGRCIQAIDYSHKDNEGHANKLPDSLRSAFKTEHGRVVYDGAGIYPDVEVPQPKLSNISISLLRNDLIFDFATKFHSEHDSIPAPESFEISDATFNEFMGFLEDKEYHYQTRSEELIDKLEVQLEKENYMEAVEPSLAELRDQLAKDKENDLLKFSDEIKRLLKEEIVARYYSQSGVIRSSFRDDPIIIKAVEVLANKELYKSILLPSN